MHLVSHIVASGETSQDRAQVFRFGDRVVLGGADGVGGRNGGAEAADLAMKIFAESASHLNSKEACLELLSEVDEAIEKHSEAGETTMVIAVVQGSEIFGASAGDSGAWLVSEHGIDDLSAHQIRRPFLGSGAALPIGFQRPQLSGTLLVATDGLLKYAPREAICKTLLHSHFDFACPELVRLVRYASGALPDDVAIALCRLA